MAVVAFLIVVNRTKRVRKVHGGQNVEGFRVGLTEVLGHSQPVAHLGPHRALGLVHELHESRNVVDEGVIGMH